MENGDCFDFRARCGFHYSKHMAKLSCAAKQQSKKTKFICTVLENMTANFSISVGIESHLYIE